MNKRYGRFRANIIVYRKTKTIRPRVLRNKLLGKNWCDKYLNYGLVI